MMYFYCYKITNLINNKIYIGVHKTANLNDGYMGSGTILKNSISKYGISNFKKEILEFFESYEEALLKEKSIVTEEFLLREDVYNLRRGGNGGFGDYHQKLATEKKRKEKNSRIDEYYKNPKLCKCCSSVILYEKKQNSFCDSSCSTKYNNLRRVEKGWKPSELQKQKTSEKLKGNKNQIGEKNSQFGTMWICNKKTKQIKKINKEDLIPEGWDKGKK